MKRWLIITAIVLLSLALILLAGSFWLLHSDSGSGFIVKRAQGALPGLEIAAYSGNLSEGLELQDVALSTDGADVDISKLRLAAGLGWLPLKLVIEDLAIEQLNLQLKDNPTETEQEPPATLDFSAPLPLELRRFSLQQATISSADQTEPLVVNAIETQLHWDQELDIQSLRLDAPGLSISSSGSSGAAQPFDHGFQFEASLQPGNPWLALDQRIELRGQTNGSLSDLTVLAQFSGPVRGDIELSSRDLLSQPQWQATLSDTDLIWPLQGTPQWRLNLNNFTAAAEAGNISFSGNGQVAGEMLPVMQLELAGAGDNDKIQLQSLSLTGEGQSLSGSGSYALDNGEADAIINLQEIDLSRWIEDWNSDYPLLGRLALQWHQQILEVPELELGLAGTDTTLNGEFSYAQDRLQGRLNWRNLQTPGVEPPLWRSPAGNLTIAGTPTDYALNGELQVESGDNLQGRFQLQGQGGDSSFTLETLSGEALDGSLQASGRADWSEELAWQLALATHQLNPALLVPDAQGRIDLNLSARGDSHGMNVDLSRLNGELLNLPLEGKGRIHAQGDIWQIENFSLTAADANFQADGSVGGEVPLEFSLAVPRLTNLIRGSSGSIQASGELSRDAARLELNSESLGWQDLQLQSAQIGLNARLGQEPQLNLDLKAANLQAGLEAIDSIDLKLDGDRQGQQLQAALEHPVAALQARIEGSFSSTDSEPWTLAALGQLLQQGWQGAFTELSIAGGENIDFSLAKNAPVSYQDNQLKLDELCLQDNDQARLCTGLSLADGVLNRFDLDLSAFPLSLPATLAQLDWTLTQTLSGRIDWTQQDAASAAEAQAAFILSAGELQQPEGQPLPTGEGRLNFTLGRGWLVTGDFTLPIRNDTRLQADWELANLNQGVNSPVKGSIQGKVGDLDLLRWFVPGVDHSAGQLDLNVIIGGSLSKPVFTGSGQLADGQLAYAPLGLELRDWTVDASLEQGSRVQLRSTFTAGEGQGDIDGQIQLQGFAPDNGRISVTGENLRLLNVPTMQASLSPDLSMQWQPGQYAIQGRLLIPSASIKPAPGEAQVIAPSEDVIIVDEPDPPQQPAAELNLDGSLRLELGDSVKFLVAGTDVNINGGIDLSWDNQGAIPMANGTLFVNGEYQAYGQLLQINDGEIRFPAVAADNPSLDMRAVREIFGDPAVEYAGVSITGNAALPKIELFTDPPTNREKALAYVLTGSDFDHANGVGALNVGTYLLPKLFVSYGIGLFDNGNVLSARYDLSSRWGVKAQSGERDTGVDLLYSIDR